MQSYCGGFQFVIFQIITCEIVSICIWCHFCCIALASVLAYVAALFVTSCLPISKRPWHGREGKTRDSKSRGCRFESDTLQSLTNGGLFLLFLISFYKTDFVCVLVSVCEVRFCANFEISIF